MCGADTRTSTEAGRPSPTQSAVISRTRKWRNWQTHQLEGLAVAIPWGFESPLPHQKQKAPAIAGVLLFAGAWGSRVDHKAPGAAVRCYLTVPMTFVNTTNQAIPLS